jgi:hypothetical protein
MSPVSRLDAMRASLTYAPHQDHDGDEAFEMNDFEAELKRLAATNQELMDQFPLPSEQGAVATEAVDDDEVTVLRRTNEALRARIEELESAGAGQTEEGWQERQREYEMLLEEKSEVIRNLHLQIQEMQESAIGGNDAPPPANSPPASATRLGQAEEILRLKRELEAQRRQLEQDEQDMMAQMRQMEIAMAKERAEMARQRQEMARQQADINREIENNTRAPELRERLNTLRRPGDSKPTATSPPIPGGDETPKEQKSSGFFRRIFGQ